MLDRSILDESRFSRYHRLRSQVYRLKGGLNMSTLAAIETLPSGTWQVDPVHSQVGFAVAYSGGTFRGTFAPVAATLEVDESGSTTLAGSAPVAGIRVQDENLAAHLLTP